VAKTTAPLGAARASLLGISFMRLQPKRLAAVKGADATLKPRQSSEK
jgi:hypothetical protein